MMWKNAVAAVALCLAALAFGCNSLPPAFAPKDAPEYRDFASNNGEYVLRADCSHHRTLTLRHMTPASETIVWKEARESKGSWLSRALVTDDGRRVVLVRLSAKRGAESVTFLGPNGKPLKSHDDRSVAERLKIRESGPWWTDNAWFGFLDGGKELAFITAERVFGCFDVETGELSEPTAGKKADIRSAAIADLGLSLPAGGPAERLLWATHMGTLSVEESVPELKIALKDTSVTCYMSMDKGPLMPVTGVKVAAAMALARMIGPEAVPLIEAELPDANENTRFVILWAIDSLDTKDHQVVESPYSAYALATWERLAANPAPDVRRFALVQRLRRDDGTYLRAHSELLNDKDNEVRDMARETRDRIKTRGKSAK